MKKEYIQPIVTEVLVEPSYMMADSAEGYNTGGEGAGSGTSGPPSGPGGMGAKESGGALWEEDAFSNDVFSENEN